MAFFVSEISRNAFSGCVRMHVFQSSRPKKLEVNSALFPQSLPAIPKPPQSEHVIIRLVSLSEFPRYDHYFISLFHVSSLVLSLIHISEPTRRTPISYAVFCLKTKNI